MAPDLERLARMPWPVASLASSGIKAFSSVLDRSCSRKACRVLRNKPANSAHELEALISTTRTASIRGFGGSTPKRRGGSPLSTQRQNFRSAVTMRCWYSGSAWVAISTHLPPPVITERTALLRRHHPHIVLQLRHVFLGRCFLRERPRQHELGLEHLTGSLRPGRRGWPPSSAAPDVGSAVACPVTICPVLASYQRRFNASVARPSCTTRLPDRSAVRPPRAFLAIGEVGRPHLGP